MQRQRCMSQPPTCVTSAGADTKRAHPEDKRPIIMTSQARAQTTSQRPRCRLRRRVPDMNIETEIAAEDEVSMHFQATELRSEPISIDLAKKIVLAKRPTYEHLKASKIRQDKTRKPHSKRLQHANLWTTTRRAHISR